ncbi:hypothetical protein [Nocardioides sp. GXQ0305]|uniref:hypothetical protein n=1 Tax=Nocardioides sp. GXQ0305 TaxID=3423912 RepID=UPI003D7E02D7
MAARQAPQPQAAAAASASTFLDVDAQFGGNVAAAVAEAERSGGRSPVVWLGPEYAISKTIEITRPVSIRGGGKAGTRFRHAGSFTGPIFRTSQLKRNGQWESTARSAPITTFDPDVDDGGVEFRDFSIVDDDRSTPGRMGMYLMSVDDMWMSNVSFGYLTGTALKLGADEADKRATSPRSGRVRESNFDRINVYRCGSGSPTGSPDVPALIVQSAAGEGDGSNQLFFTNLRFVYNEGRMLISGRDDANSLRRLMFRDTQLHALADNASWSPTKFFPFDMVTLEGGVREVFFDGVFINGGKAGTAGWAMKGSSLTSQTPKRLVLRNVNVVNTAGDLVRVEKGDSVAVDGTSLGSVGGKIIRNQAGSGLARYYVHELGINSPSGKSSGLTGKGGFFHSGLQVDA